MLSRYYVLHYNYKGKTFTHSILGLSKSLNGFIRVDYPPFVPTTNVDTVTTLSFPMKMKYYGVKVDDFLITLYDQKILVR